MKNAKSFGFGLPRPRMLSVLAEGYGKAAFLKDLPAGVSVGIIALPLSMAIAIASGATPAQGIYAAAIAGFIASLLGGSRYQIAGPSGTLVVVSYSVIATRGAPALAVATLMAGLILIALGLSGFGKLIKYIPYPVTTGFTAGIGILIFSQQVKDFAGLAIPSLPPDFPSQQLAYFRAAGTVSAAAVAVGAGTLAVLLACRRLAPRVPAAIVAIAAATAAAALLGLPVETIGSRFGGIPSGLPAPRVPALSWDLVHGLLPEAFTIALLISIETLLSAVVGDGMTGERHDSNMELIAQGCANAASSFFGGVPSTAALARTAANIKGGAASPVSGMVHAATLALFIVVLAPLASAVPLASLSAVLMLVAWDMSDLGRVVRLVKKAPRSDAFTLVATLVLALGAGITIAVEVGVALAALLFLRRMIEVTDVKLETTVPVLDLPDHDASIEIFEITGPFFFGVADVLQDTLDEVSRKPAAYVLRMRDVPAIDATGINALEAFLRKSRKQGARLVLSEVRPQPLAAMEKAGFLDELGMDNVAADVEEAVWKLTAG